ncbi:hypothetical protein EON77_00025 [bacterium]|nr:MAG: hypothetical protein EON77_00025 [bacterium]
MSAVPMGGHAAHPQERESDQAPSFLKWGPGFSVLGGLGLIGSLVAMIFPDARGYMLNGYLFGFIFWVMIALGCLGLTLLYHSVKGNWTSGILRLLEAGGSGTMFVGFLILLFPIFFGLPHVYEWYSHMAGDPILMKKAQYLNAPGFIGRSAIFLLFWAGLAHWLRRSSLRSDTSRSPVEAQWRANYATPGMVFFVVTLTFAMTDWGMSLTPHWSSTMYGPLMMISGSLGALALCVVLLCTNARRAPYNTIVAPAFTKDLGNMLFVHTMLWAYFSVSQLIIIWNGNLPETASYYARRSTEWWNAIGMITIIGQFVIPFLVLNSPRVKRYPDRLARIAGWMFVVHFADVFQIIGRALPERPWSHALPTGYEVWGFLTFGCIWFALFCRTVKQAPLLPGYDTRLEEQKLHAH